MTVLIPSFLKLLKALHRGLAATVRMTIDFVEVGNSWLICGRDERRETCENYEAAASPYEFGAHGFLDGSVAMLVAETAARPAI